MEKLETKKENKIKWPVNLLKKMFIYFLNKLDKDDVLSPVQKLGFEIFELCLNNNDNIFYLNSVNADKKYIINKKFVIDKDVSMFILLDGYRLTIVNHLYKYDVDMPSKTVMKMNKLFDARVERDRKEMEEEILSNIKSSLEIVLNELKGNLTEK